MRYIDAERPGGPEVLVVKEGPAPVPGSGEVLIRVHAAGINRPDTMQREGKYPPPAGASPLLGLEVAGEVSAVGDGVSRWSLGDRVCALTNGGGYAEFVTAPAGQCLPVPSGLRMEEAAALPETFFTVWTNVFDRASLKEGESFLVHGGSGGIGTTAVQMAKQRGARVFATAGTGEKCAACRRLGAEIAVNYREDDFVQVLKQATEGRGVDVILDMVGGRLREPEPGTRRNRRPGCQYRFPERVQGGDRPDAAPDEAAHPDRLHPSRPHRRGQGGDRGETRSRDLAAHRIGTDQAGHGGRFPPGEGCGCPSAHGTGKPHRKNRPGRSHFFLANVSLEVVLAFQPPRCLA